jgi:hypothetical protein
MIQFLSGAVTLGFLVVGVCFLRFWRRTRDPLFLTFAVAFWLFALNQLLAFLLERPDRELRFEYVFRVLGYLLILAGIAGKNIGTGSAGKS